MRTPDEYRRELKAIGEALAKCRYNTVIDKIKALYLEALRNECMYEIESRLIHDDADGTFFDEMVEAMIDKHYPREWRE